MDNNPQTAGDKRFIQDLITNNTLVVEEGQNDRKNDVIVILDRVSTRGKHRGDPTKNTLVQLCHLCPVQPVVAPTLTKPEIVRVIRGLSLMTNLLKHLLLHRRV